MFAGRVLGVPISRRLYGPPKLMKISCEGDGFQAVHK